MPSIRTALPTARHRALLALATTIAALAACASSAAAADATPAHDDPDSARAIAVDGRDAFPESVASDDRYVYTGSIKDGTIYRGRVGADKLEPFLSAGRDGRTQATGIKTTGKRLLVAGAFTGRFFVYTASGKLVSRYSVPDTGAPTLVNDEAVTLNGDVYITDSFRAVVYRIPAAEVNARPSGIHRTLTAAYRLPDYVTGQSNGNGIVASADNTSLVIGYWYSGALYRLELATGDIRKIAAPPLTSADGIARRGNTLYVDRSVNNEIATVRLSADGARATVVSERSFQGADTLTGVSVSGDRLLVTNSEMDTYLYGTPLTSPVFTVESLPLH